MTFFNLKSVLLISFVHICLATYLPKEPAVFGPNTERYAVGRLPNITYKLPPSWAGQIKIPGTKDDALFFWLFETETYSQNDNLISMRPNFTFCVTTDEFTQSG